MVAPELLVWIALLGADERVRPVKLPAGAIQPEVGFDVAADGRGAVAVVWHAPARHEEVEEARRVWVARPSDDGATFLPETAIDAPRHGACACCGMKAIFTRGGPSSAARLWVLYRCALHGKMRDMHALVAGGAGDPVRSFELSLWPVNTCVMSTAALANGPGDSVLVAYETQGQVFVRSSTAGGEPSRAVAPAGSPGDRKHPRLAVNAKGERLLCWMEGTGWERGGTLCWQPFDRGGAPVTDGSGRVEGVPAWSFGEPLALKDDSFVLVH